jgi:hypothetical protein
MVRDAGGVSGISLPIASALPHPEEMTTTPRERSEGLGVRQRALLVLMADGQVRSALDVEDEGIGFTEGQARATLRSLETRQLLAATSFVGGSIRRTFGLTEAGRGVAARLVDR